MFDIYLKIVPNHIFFKIRVWCISQQDRLSWRNHVNSSWKPVKHNRKNQRIGVWELFWSQPQWKRNRLYCRYSRVHKSSDSFFSKILEKPSIVQKKMIPHINGLVFFTNRKTKGFWNVLVLVLVLNFESFFCDLLASVGLVNKNGCKGQH